MSTGQIEQGQIFVSYRHGLETEFALKLAADLKNAGLEVWIDRLDGIKGGIDWRASIERSINTCAALVPVLSPDYLDSTYCRNELARADDLKRPTFPVLLRPVAPADWPISIQRLQYEDFTGWRDEAAYRERFDALLSRLLEAKGGRISVPVDAETRYLTSLIATIEAKRGVSQYIELGAEVEGLAEHRPAPVPEDEWGYVWLIPGSGRLGSKPPPGEGSYSLTSKQKLAGIREAVDRLSRFVLTGEPGAGKSTALRRLVREAARRRLENPTTAPLPVLLELPSWRNELNPADFVQAHWPFHGDSTEPLRTGDVWLFLDGLNEMGAASSERAARLQQWVASSDGPSRVIITCRAGDYATKPLRFDDLPTVMIQNLELGQVRNFANNYLNEKAPAFLDRVLTSPGASNSNRDLTAIARNPYMLSCLVILFEQSPGGDLPRNTGALFRAFARALWERERKRGTPGWVPYEQAERAFGVLAYSMINEDAGTSVPQEYAIGKLAESPQLLLAGESASYLNRAGGLVRFYHQLLQEYFAAVGFRNAGTDAGSILPQYRHLPGGTQQDVLKSTGRRTGKWDEVLVALCGIVDHPDELVIKLLESDPYLATRCVQSGVLLDPETRRKTLDRLIATLRATDQPIAVAAMKALQLLGHPDAAPAVVSILLEDSSGSKGDRPRQVAAVALGRIGGPVAIAGLTRALESGSSRVRVRAAESLADIGDPAAALALVAALWDDTETVMYFSRRKCVGQIAREALVLLGDRAPERVVPALLDGLRNLEPRIRSGSAAILGQLGDISATSGLWAAMTYDVDAGVRTAASRALGLIDKSRDLPALLRCYRESSGRDLTTEAHELRQMAGTAFVVRLLHALADEEEPSTFDFVRNALFYGDKRRIAPGLIDALESSDRRVRVLAVEMLGSLPDDTAIPALERKRDEPGCDIIPMIDKALLALDKFRGISFEDR